MWTCVMTLSDMTPMAIGDIFGYIMVHGTPVKSLSLEPKSSPIPDDHSHHAAYEAQLHDILRGALIGVSPHH